MIRKSNCKSCTNRYSLFWIESTPSTLFWKF